MQRMSAIANQPQKPKTTTLDGAASLKQAASGLIGQPVSRSVRCKEALPLGQKMQAARDYGPRSKGLL